MALAPRAHAVAHLPPETFGGALRAGLRYATQASVLQSVLIKAASFFVFASALPALLPIVVNRELQAAAGHLWPAAGLHRHRRDQRRHCCCRGCARAIDRDRLVLVATLVYAGCMLALALVRDIPALYAVMLVNGLAWISVLSSLQIAAQISVPAWVRARALSLYIVVVLRRHGGRQPGLGRAGAADQRPRPRC